MDIKWIHINSSLQNGILILNKVDFKKFDKFLEHIMVSGVSGELFTEEELIKLEKILKLNTEEVNLLVKTTSYLVKRMSKFILRPSHTYHNLVKDLKIEDEKASCLLKHWSQTLNTSMNELGISNLGNINTVTNVEWQVNIELSSDTSKKTKIPKSIVKLELNNGEHEDLLLDLPHEQLYGLFQQLGSIQAELDNLER